jgi:hypothetical protein
LKLFQKWGKGDEGEQWRGMNSRMINMTYCKNFCKCRNVLPPSTTTIIIIKRE